MDIYPETDPPSLIGSVFDQTLQDLELAEICRRFQLEEAEQAASLVRQPVEPSSLDERVTMVMRDIGCSDDVALALLDALDRL